MTCSFLTIFMQWVCSAKRAWGKEDVKKAVAFRRSVYTVSSEEWRSNQSSVRKRAMKSAPFSGKIIPKWHLSAKLKKSSKDRLDNVIFVQISKAQSFNQGYTSNAIHFYRKFKGTCQLAFYLVLLRRHDTEEYRDFFYNTFSRFSTKQQKHIQ